MSDADLTESRMLTLTGGSFTMGSRDFYDDEGPVHEARVERFSLDITPVTNHEFARFVDETEYVTVAERELDPADFPGADRANLAPGSLVFVGTPGPVDLSDWRQWWKWVPGAHWRQPYGPESSIEGWLHHPVVQVAFEDATAYGAGAGKRLPTEAEWE
uniref:SUMF1/EgtB/PvdO family nonheme iron enzyme n=1 Tax=Mycetocola sp. TaxID=1871042 RepID=UPI003989FC8B